MADLVERVRDVIDEMAFEARTSSEIARAIILLIEADMKERCAKVVRDCALFDDNQRLLNSDVRATCAAAIRSMKGTLDA